LPAIIRRVLADRFSVLNAAASAQQNNQKDLENCPHHHVAGHLAILIIEAVPMRA
jgi:hypothetical protein